MAAQTVQTRMGKKALQCKRNEKKVNFGVIQLNQKGSKNAQVCEVHAVPNSLLTIAYILTDMHSAKIWGGSSLACPTL